MKKGICAKNEVALAEIKKGVSELNEEAEKNWQNERILEISNWKEKGDIISLTVQIGKFEKTFHDIEIDKDEETVKIIAESQKNEIIEDVITYIISPAFFGK